MSETDDNILDVLMARGFVKQTTDADTLRAAFSAGPVTFYIGFDPTADCLHVGHLLPIMAMSWLQRAGHKPIVVMGGGTARVGDPSGKTKTRELLDDAQIAANLAAQRVLFAKYIDLDNAIVVDNAEWLMGLGYIDFLRDIGRHFSVNRMLSSSGAQLRLERGQGYSFIEFNYHLLQSYDYLELNRRYGCTLQCGGDDQWFNILGGVDLVRREQAAEVHALTIPLLLTADGKKMGKTEAGAIWIDGTRLSPFDFYQYWYNVHDDDALKLLKLYTYLPLDEIDSVAGEGILPLKRRLAFEVTALCHGTEEARKAEQAARGDADQMPTHPVTFPVNIIDALVATELCRSKGEARRKIKENGVKLDGERVTDPHTAISASAVLQLGKKRFIRLVASA
ncbi:MAG: tyrosyl-tRNA synthetase [Myxococcota bacterium]|jgi:tyrosyl-tRNA synthetase